MFMFSSSVDPNQPGNTRNTIQKHFLCFLGHPRKIYYHLYYENLIKFIYSDHTLARLSIIYFYLTKRKYYFSQASSIKIKINKMTLGNYLHLLPNFNDRKTQPAIYPWQRKEYTNTIIWAEQVWWTC